MTVSNWDARVSRGSRRRAAITTEQPEEARVRAIDAPIPKGGREGLERLF